MTRIHPLDFLMTHKEVGKVLGSDHDDGVRPSPTHRFAEPMELRMERILHLRIG